MSAPTIEAAIGSAKLHTLELQALINSPDIPTTEEMEVLLAATRLSLTQVVMLTHRQGMRVHSVAKSLGLYDEQITAIDTAPSMKEKMR